MELRTLQHQDQTFIYTDHRMTLPAGVTEKLERILTEWQQIFPREHTLIQTRHHVPSLFVRFDCVVSADGEVQIYELQDGPAWVGYAGVANDAFREIRDAIVREDWPTLKLWRSDREADKDDELWLQRITTAEALETPDPIIVRNLDRRDVSDTELATITGKSLRPVLLHNNKRYGAHFGWWRPINWENGSGADTLPWDTAFVLKPQYGYGSMDIMVWKPNDRTGRATQTQIRNALEKHGAMYLQPFIVPMQMDINGAAYNFIFRPYFVYSVQKKKYIPMHGVWTARPAPAIRIHGASDSITGPLQMKTNGRYARVHHYAKSFLGL